VKAGRCESRVARPNPRERCRHDELISSTWISAHHSHATTNHDWLGSVLGLLHHHATILAHSANPVSHDAVSHPLCHPARASTILTNPTSEIGSILLAGRGNLSECYQGEYCAATKSSRGENIDVEK
jgi:hypothetical protein